MAASRDTAKLRGLDDPPNSRLFILCQKGTSEQEFQDAFDKFGKIEDIWIIKDKRTNEDRGIAYIKFSKTSEAMHAMEEMSGRTLPGSSKGLKVVVANSKRDGSTRDPREDERLVRLFVIIPKYFTEHDLREEFSKYGDLESVTVLKDRSSGDNKGFGYVRYFKPLHAAIAFENCDSSFKPKFAEPQRSRDEREEIESHGYLPNTGFSGAGHKRNYEDDYVGGYSSGESQSSYWKYGSSASPSYGTSQGLMGGAGPMDVLADYPTSSQCSRLVIQAPLGLTQGYLSKLCNLIPGMEYCDLNENTGIAYVRYNSCQCAAYARDRLNDFEYPLGSPLVVHFAEDSLRSEFPMNVDTYSHGLGSSRRGGFQQGSQMSESMDLRQKAFLLLEKAGMNPHNLLKSSGSGSSGSSFSSFGADRNKERTPYCSFSLPPALPTVSEDGNNLAQRLFVVCQPSGVNEKILKDAFCRFGNLIDVYLLQGRNYGYAKYASKESAKKAIDMLHGQTIAGQRMKVFEAEPPKSHPSNLDEGPSKKQRL